jgi:hypothetical protein
MGIVLFLVQPSLRVLLMLLVFTREGDFRFAAAAGVVLAIICLSARFYGRAKLQSFCSGWKLWKELWSHLCREFLKRAHQSRDIPVSKMDH